ncbi:S-adenosylmethionine-dependent methyltransferase [Nocardioides salarius]|uniref:S-adenosylmethionine-dependent methyltransferase n=1 Tax=Nocardioides salarius TaxID=374513 RepID=A0ABS2M8I2_9ACTN|nr:methyltransferase domain-containing protein [Nocardioides salarius]MBM7507495.1 S-adenosylmethionine-dependent methyltransferase [Nocardioides salarius]
MGAARDDDVFEERLAQWQAWCEAPWGRLRFSVVRETLRRQAEALGGPGGGLRVLDVGGGDGRDAVALALAGHHVTVLDPAASWLTEARSRAESAGVGERLVTVEGSIDDLGAVGGGFDLVLCHFVVHYRPAETGAADVRRLAGALRPGGRVSVMAPNPAARVLGRLVREGPEAALEQLERDDMESATFATTARAVPPEEVEGLLVDAGLEVVGRYAARVANDYLADDTLKADPDYFAALERLELALCDQEPFLRLGALWQVVAQRPARPGVDER